MDRRVILEVDASKMIQWLATGVLEEKEWANVKSVFWMLVTLWLVAPYVSLIGIGVYKLEDVWKERWVKP